MRLAITHWMHPVPVPFVTMPLVAALSGHHHNAPLESDGARRLRSQIFRCDNTRSMVRVFYHTRTTVLVYLFDQTPGSFQEDHHPVLSQQEIPTKSEHAKLIRCGLALVMAHPCPTSSGAIQIGSDPCPDLLPIRGEDYLVSFAWICVRILWQRIGRCPSNMSSLETCHLEGRILGRSSC